jgi:hypothetical protein
MASEFSGAIASPSASSGLQVGAAPATPVVVYFLMRGIDTGSGPLYYHYWTVTGSPDLTGASTIPPFGGPLTEIVIVGTY